METEIGMYCKKSNQGPTDASGVSFTRAWGDRFGIAWVCNDVFFRSTLRVLCIERLRAPYRNDCFVICAFPGYRHIGWILRTASGEHWQPPDPLLLVVVASGIDRSRYRLLYWYR